MLMKENGILIEARRCFNEEDIVLMISPVEDSEFTMKVEIKLK